MNRSESNHRRPVQGAVHWQKMDIGPIWTLLVACSLPNNAPTNAWCFRLRIKWSFRLRTKNPRTCAWPTAKLQENKGILFLWTLAERMAGLQIKKNIIRGTSWNLTNSTIELLRKLTFPVSHRSAWIAMAFCTFTWASSRKRGAWQRFWLISLDLPSHHLAAGGFEICQLDPLPQWRMLVAAETWSHSSTAVRIMTRCIQLFISWWILVVNND